MKIEPNLPFEADVWDLDGLPADSVGCIDTRRRPPRHRPGDALIRGRIAFAWIAVAFRLPGAGSPAAMALWFLCFRLGPSKVVRGLRISDESARRGLRAAELAGLLSASREPGCKLAVCVLDLPELNARPDRRPLYGPIPWEWWLPASRLPGRSLQVASVCWLLAGWSRSAEFELALDGWAEFGLSRFSASRGVDILERAGLVSVGRTPGRFPVVTILETDAVNA